MKLIKQMLAYTYSFINMSACVYVYMVFVLLPPTSANQFWEMFWVGFCGVHHVMIMFSSSGWSAAFLSKSGSEVGWDPRLSLRRGL